MAKIRPRLVTAGPGAGKTHDLASRIHKILPLLPPTRFLAGISFTNAACTSIENHLSNKVRLAPNIFIGTFHSFANRFIVSPFAEHVEDLPRNPLYCEVDIWEMVDKETKEKGINLPPDKMGKKHSAIRKALIKKGVVPYDELIGMSVQLLKNGRIRKHVCDRLRYLFIDEFQDADTRHLEIFEYFRKGGTTLVDVVGDPEQYIYGFTYGQRKKKPPAYNKIPYFRFKNSANCSDVVQNRRSCQEIVDFINQFRTDIRQESTIGIRGESRVIFIEEQETEKIVQRFYGLYDALPAAHSQRHQRKMLLLGKANATFEMLGSHHDIRPVDDRKKDRNSLLRCALAIMATAKDASQEQTRIALELDEHTWRRYGVELLKDIRDGRVKNADGFSLAWSHRLKMPCEVANAAVVERQLDDLRIYLNAKSSPKVYASSIHRSKGLEAVAVLVLASTVGELKKWCVTDDLVRGADKADSCRLGFVAFSRAMELLCIACSKPLDKGSRTMLENLGVVFSAN